MISISRMTFKKAQYNIVYFFLGSVMGSLDSGFYKVIFSCCHQNNLEKDFDISKTLGTILDCRQSTIRLDKVNSINTI